MQGTPLSGWDLVYSVPHLKVEVPWLQVWESSLELRCRASWQKIQQHTWPAWALLHLIARWKVENSSGWNTETLTQKSTRFHTVAVNKPRKGEGQLCRSWSTDEESQKPLKLNIIRTKTPGLPKFSSASICLYPRANSAHYSKHLRESLVTQIANKSVKCLQLCSWSHWRICIIFPEKVNARTKSSECPNKVI